ncbi:MAG: hypothetical protein ACJ8JD_03325 [Chthoniobacterales bacterium]
MRSKLLGSLVAAFLVAGCSQKGVVVEKRLKPSPFAYSTGMDGIYSFMLRDEQGRVHSQMVTPEVFQRYEVGDLFDDQQGGPVRREGFSKDSSAVSDSKEVKPVHHHHAAHHTPHHASTASHKAKRHTLRAVVKPREEEAQTAAIAAPIEPHGLDVHP